MWFGKFGGEEIRLRKKVTIRSWKEEYVLDGVWNVFRCFSGRSGGGGIGDYVIFGKLFLYYCRGRWD